MSVPIVSYINRIVKKTTCTWACIIIFIFYAKCLFQVKVTTKLTFVCSKSTIETPEKGMKYVQS